MVGCTSPPPPTALTVEPDQYDAAFQAVKDVLRDFEFELDRVDARAGIITTVPRASSGIATPWIPHTSTAQDAFEGLAQFEQRTARVEFVPQDGKQSSERVEPADLTRTMRIEVQVERLYRPGRRVNATSVRLTSFTFDPRSSHGGGNASGFASPQGKDAALADRLMRAIRESIVSVSPSDPADSSEAKDPA